MNAAATTLHPKLAPAGASWFEASARQRLAGLVAAGSLDEFAGPPARLASPHLPLFDLPQQFDDGMIVGRATLAGEPVFVAAQEGRFMGGAFGEVHGAKLTGLLRAARELRAAPVLILFDTGGVRLQEANAGEIAVSEIVRAVIDARAAGVPVVGLVGGRAGCYGGGGIIAACCSALAVSEAGRIGVSGPEVIESRRGVDVHIGSPGVIIGWIADPCRQAVRRPFLPRLVGTRRRRVRLPRLVGARRIFVAQNHRIARRLGNLARLRGGGVRLGRDGRRFAVAARVIGEIDRLLREQARLLMRGRLLERGQIVERLQAEVVEKLFCRRVERRTARHVAMTDHFDPAAVLELLDDLRVHRDAADLLDVAARDRLPVRDDRERLQHGARILRRLLGMQAIEIRAHRRLALEAPARRERDEFDPPSGPFLFQIFEQCSDCIRRHAVGKELAQIAELQRFLRADQGSLEDDLRLLGIHAARSDPVVKRTGSIEQTKGTEDALARF